MKIAVTDTGKPEKQKLYMDWLQSFNSQADIKTISYREEFSSLDEYDGLVLTGGEDVDPQLSKASPIESVGKFDRKRDDFEFRMLEQAFKNTIPILGICRGMQVTNVFLGGTLIADLPQAGFEHHTSGMNEPPMRHAIDVNEGTQLYKISNSLIGEINSYHHQSILNVADDLVISAMSRDRVIEAVEWKEQGTKSFLLLVQWHPERMMERENPFTVAIGNAFFAEALKFNSKKTHIDA